MLKNLALSLLFLIGMTQLLSAQTLTTILNSGPSTNRLDLVVLGDGYTTSDLSKYATDVEQYLESMFQQQPFLEYKQFFNIHRIDVISTDSGADHPETNTYRNTALDAAYNCSNIQRLICVNNTKVFNIVNDVTLPSQRDQILVLVNDSTYGGSGGAIAVSSINTWGVEVVLHELGHSLGLLADEYGGPPPPYCNSSVEPSEPNATKTTIRETIKWILWINESTGIPTHTTTMGAPGLYAGAKYCDTGLYRPTYDSKMRSVGQPFEQINSEQLVKRFYNWVSPIDASSPADTTITAAKGQTIRFSIETPQPATHTLDSVWLLDGQLEASGESYMLDSSLLSIGDHSVEAIVHDPTTMVRLDPDGALTEGASWMLRVVPSHNIFDTDGDRKSDLTVWRPGNGVWYALPSNSPGNYTGTPWGLVSDIPIPGGYDGDGKSDIAVWRPSNGTWYVRPSGAAGTYTANAWGIASDIPVPGDYDGDGKDDIAVWRSSNGTWYVRPSGSPGLYTSTNWGVNTDIPIPGDYDGDGKTDVAVWRPGTGTWYIRKSSVPGSYTSTVWGTASDIPVPGDYDADGKMDISVWRPGNGTWYIRPSNAGGYTATSWGTNGDTPVSGDYDGDGKTDIAVWRSGNGTWYIKPSGSPGSYTAKKWGIAGDMPISAVTGILRSIP